MTEKRDTSKTVGGYIGTGLAVIVGVCIAALLLTATGLLIRWALGGGC